MSKAIRASIDKAFGFGAVCINSALVSAQNRQRLYWVGRRNADGTYSKVHVEQPEDRGILLKDVLDRVGIHLNPIASGKSRTIDAHMGKCENNLIPRINHPNPAKQQYDCMAEPVGTTREGKAYCMTAGYANGSGENIGNYAAHTLEKGCKSMAAEPVAQPFGETNGKAFALTSSYYKGQPAHRVLEKSQRTHAAEPVRVGTWPNEAKNQDHDSQQYRIYDTDTKCVTLCGNGGVMGAKTGLYALDCRFACAVEWDEDGKPTKAISGADGKTYTVYEVKDGQITIKGKQYPIKLADGFYIIRKLTVIECKRLQTVPEWYEFPVSDTQAYKMLGNGWTVEVIVHLIKATQEAELPDLFGMAVMS
jgi:DNA (cytosine-5)-methyltransferase 3A